MRRIIGLDPGTSMGYAYTDDGKVHVEQSGVWDLKPDRFSGGGMRFLRAKRYLEELTSGLVGDGCVVFYEEVRRHRGVDAAHVYGGLTAVITCLCESKAIPYQAIPVGTIKKRATGKGNANKQAMIDEANKEYCNGESIITDDNRADAIHILACGIEELGG